MAVFNHLVEVYLHLLPSELNRIPSTLTCAVGSVFLESEDYILKQLSVPDEARPQKPSRIRSPLSVFSEDMSYRLREQSKSKPEQPLQIPVGDATHQTKNRCLPTLSPSLSLLVAFPDKETCETIKSQTFTFCLTNSFESVPLLLELIVLDRRYVPVRSGYVQ